MSNEKKATMKDTKATIFKAYEKALKSFKETKSVDPRVKAKREADAKSVEATNEVSDVDINKYLGDVKTTVNNALYKAECELTDALSQLREIEKSIKVREDNLKDVYGIEKQADTFAALVEANNVTQEEFSQEVAEATFQWNKNLKALKDNFATQETNLEQEFDRKQDQFEYNHKRMKEKALDDFEQEKLIRLRDLNNKVRTTEADLDFRTKALDDRQEEIQEMVKSISEFDQKLSDAVNEAKDTASKKEGQKWGFEKRALEKDHALEVAVLEQKVDNFTEKVSSLVEENQALRKSIESANNKVVEVSTKAIEGAQTKHFHSPSVDTSASYRNGKS